MKAAPKVVVWAEQRAGSRDALSAATKVFEWVVVMVGHWVVQKVC